MRIIKSKCLKTYNALIVFLISLFGFASSCDIAGGKAMYGTPIADFIVKGKIEAANTNHSIAGIKVEMVKERDTENGKIQYTLNTSLSAEVTGAYKVTADGEFPDDQTFKIKFTDIDGTQNGEFETLDTTIVFHEPEFINGRDVWDQGQTEKEVNVKLKPKK